MSSRITVRILMGLFLGQFALLGCQNEASSDLDAFNNRPQNREQFIAIIKLKSPALLSSTKMVKGKKVISPAAKAIVDLEHKVLAAKLKRLSPQIKIINHYKRVLNGVAVVAPVTLLKEFEDMAGTSYVEAEQSFTRLSVERTGKEGGFDPQKTSAHFVGATKIHQQLGFKGSGISVGVIDTGIDYTHRMFGGEGTPAAFESNDPSDPKDGGFPTTKVVGGIDLVGTEYNSGSPDFNKHIPIVDMDPLDEGGHGTHVAGTIAGLGDDLHTYSGMAPEADLYAIKVFGKDGSTGDSVIIAALEYAADPNGDFNLNDQIDVLNLSLGSPYGAPHILYSEAMNNLIQAGTIVVAAAGNSGHNSYIVGSPGTVDEAISVAASIDYMDHNWKFDAVKIRFAEGREKVLKQLEANFTLPLSDFRELSGKLVHVGVAAEPLSEELAQQVSGHVALIDRGAVAFGTKAEHALAAGAKAFVVANNAPGDAIAMGGDCSVSIPGIMIDQASGQEIVAASANADVYIDFIVDDKFENPENIDRLTSFSSRGPRSVDSLIKPEVAAPGYQIISADMGSGDKGVKLNGTSMATPHVAGIAALLRQAHPDLDVAKIKSLIVNTALPIKDAKEEIYPVSMQGAGRVQAFEAIQSAVSVSPQTFSLGETALTNKTTVKKRFRLSNLTGSDVELVLREDVDAGLTVTAPAKVRLAAGGSKTITIKVAMAAQGGAQASAELDGRLFYESQTSGIQLAIPLLASVKKLSQIRRQIKVGTEAGVVALKNYGEHTGEALPFVLLGEDGKKTTRSKKPSQSSMCDLHSVGYRIVKTQDLQNTEIYRKRLQIAFKLYEPVTTWDLCESSIQVDTNGDGVAELEVVGGKTADYVSLAQEHEFSTMMFNAEQMRQLRTEFESKFPEMTEQDYEAAIVDIQEHTSYAHSTLSIVTIDLETLVANLGDASAKIKIAMTGDQSVPEGDDFLNAHENNWLDLRALLNEAEKFSDLKDIQVGAGEVVKLDVAKAASTSKFVIYLPDNRYTKKSRSQQIITN